MARRIGGSSPFSANNSPTYLRQSFFSVKSLASQTLHEHWGVIWGSFETIAGQVTSKDLLGETIWKIPRQFKPKKQQEGGFIFLLDVFSYPDVVGKQLMMEYVENDGRSKEIKGKIRSYGMNQYYKSLPLKTSIHVDRPTEIRIQTTHIPTYYHYEFGKRTRNDEEVDIIVFTLHIPFMLKAPTGYPVIVFDIGMDLPKGMINHKMFHDSLYDYVNRIFFYYQLANFTMGSEDSSEYLLEQLYLLIDKINEFIDVFNNKQQFIYRNQTNEPPVKERSRFISSIISGYLQTYYSVCIPFSTDTINNVRCVLDPFSIPSMKELHSNKMTIDSNPFFTLQFVTKFDPSEYFQFPLPICLIDSNRLTVQAMKDIDIVSYYGSRATYFLNMVNKRLKVGTNYYPINPIAFMVTIDHCFLIEDFITQFVNSIDKNSINVALYLLRQASITLISKGMVLFSCLIQSTTPFGKKLVEHTQSRLDLEKEDMLLLVKLFKFDQPAIVSKFQLSIASSMRQDVQITRNFF